MTLLKTVPLPKPLIHGPREGRAHTQCQCFSASRWSLNHRSSEVYATHPGVLGVPNLSQFPVWPQHLDERFPLLAVSCHDPGSHPHLMRASSENSCPTVWGRGVNILAKANLVLPCLLWCLRPSALSFHTWFQKPKNASNPSASPWPSGTCTMPNGQLQQASLSILSFLCASYAVSHAPFGNQLLASVTVHAPSLTVLSLSLQPLPSPFM